MTDRYERLEIPVAGGVLTAGRWGHGDRLVVASHGITANHLSWLGVGELLARDESISLVAVDHRGRAGSAETPGPYGLIQHADDLIAVLDHRDCQQAVLLGHSMGGFVATLAAERHADRVSRLVLVDGGLPFPLDLPADVDVEAAVESVIGPALTRLDQRWPDEDSYVDLFRNHPAFQPPNDWPATAEAYVRYDAVATPSGEVRSSVSKDAVLTDGGAAIVDPQSSSAIERIATPTRLLWAPRGVLDQAPGLYQRAQIDAAVADLDHLEAQLVDGTNHYTIAVGNSGAAAVATAITAAM